jgi:sarcosine oxidase
VKIAVIGAGVHGSCSARALALAGHEVHVYEQFEVGHARGSSHGTSRIIRRAYADPYYAALMVEVFPLWEEFEQQLGEQLFHRCGLLIFGKGTNEWFRNARASLTATSTPFDAMGPIDVARRFGGFHLEPDEEALFEEGAGFLKAERVIRGALHIAQQHGAKVFEGVFAQPTDDGVIHGIKYDALVVCAGSWVRQFINLPTQVRLQHFAYFTTRDGLPPMTWVQAQDDHFYGFPDYGRGAKVGLHRYGPEVDPSEGPFQPDPEVIREIAEVARFRLGANSTARESFTCLYTVLPGEEFAVGALPMKVPAFFASACSGHGFKFGVWIGKLMRDLIDGKTTLDEYPRFTRSLVDPRPR